MVPFCVEIAGPPASGKTTATHRLQAYFSALGTTTCRVREAAEIAPFHANQKLDWRFNAWTLTHTVTEAIRFGGHRQNVIFDRGLFDTAVWIGWHHAEQRIDPITATMLRQLAIGGRWFNELDLIVFLDVGFEVALARRLGKRGRIFNESAFGQLKSEYATAIRTEMNGSVPLISIQTDKMSAEDVQHHLIKTIEKLISPNSHMRRIG